MSEIGTVDPLWDRIHSAMRLRSASAMDDLRRASGGIGRVVVLELPAPRETGADGEGREVWFFERYRDGDAFFVSHRPGTKVRDAQGAPFDQWFDGFVWQVTEVVFSHVMAAVAATDQLGIPDAIDLVRVRGVMES